MNASLCRTLCCLPLLVLMACSSSQDSSVPPSHSGVTISANAVQFDPTTGDVPLPNILATATALDPITNYVPATGGTPGPRPAGVPMTPPEALAYVNLREMGGTHAVSGINAPIYLRFAYPVDPATVSFANIKVFMITPDAAGTEDAALTFTDISATFSYQYTAGSTDLLLFPNVPLLPGSRYLYVVKNAVKDAASGGAVIPSVYFNALKSVSPLSGALAPLEAIRANVMAGTHVKLSGYAKVMDDLIAAQAITGIASRSDIALLGRFITTGAGYLMPNPAASTARIPMETALRSAAPAFGAAVTDATVLEGAPYLGAFWNALTGSTAYPASLGQVVRGSIDSAQLSMDPVVVAANAGSADLTGVAGAYHPASGVVQPFRDGAGVFKGFYHTSLKVPFIYFAPASAAPAGGYPLVIFQHGVTSQKEVVASLVPALTAAGMAVVAIDLPLHGGLALSGQSAGDAWGQTFIAVGAPLATRSNVQQGAFNLHRLELTIALGGFDTVPGIKAPARTGIRFVGHSLGSIVGAYYLAGNTTLAASGLPYTQTTLDADMKGFLSVPGARTVYLILNSPAFGPAVVAGLEAVGIKANSPTFHRFFQVTQSIVDPVDPATLTTPLALGLPSRFSHRLTLQEAVGDQTIGNEYTRYLGNALGGREILGAVGAAVAPGFKQLGYVGAAVPRIPAPFLYVPSGGIPALKADFAAALAATSGPVEGYFQFDQAGVAHSFLLDPKNPVISLAQRQLVMSLLHGWVVDPTLASPSFVNAPGVQADVLVPERYTVLGH